MAGTKISALTAGAALGGTEALPAVQTAATVKITAAQIKTFTSASPTLVTPVLGVAAGTSLALGGATIGSNALAVTGSTLLGAITTIPSAGYIGDPNGSGIRMTFNGSSTSVMVINAGGYYGMSNGNIQVPDLFWTRGGTATFQHGNADAASPVAQTIKFQDVAAGTSNTAGVNATIQAPAGTGTGNGGSLIFQVASAGSTGSAKNAWATALTIDSTKLATFAFGIGLTGNVTNGNWNGIYGWTSGSAYSHDGTDRNLLLLFGGSANRLAFGGLTSSFPAIKRSTTSLQARLADDSAFTAIQGKLTTDTAYTAGDPTTTGYLLVYDSTGTAYRVPALLN